MRRDTFTPLAELNAPLELKLAGRNYTRQYAALYFLRLRKLKAASGRLRRLAREHWLLDDPASASASGASKSSGKRKEAEGSRAGVQMVERVLDIRQGEMTGVCGTVYCSMRLKPDVLEDLTREVSALQASKCILEREGELTPCTAAIPAARAHATNVRRPRDRRVLLGG